MPVFEQGYRRYVGEKSTKTRVFIIAWENIRPRMNWKFWGLLLVLLGPYYLYGVLMFVATMGQSLGGPLIRATTAPTEAFHSGNIADPGAVLALLQGNSLTLFWELLNSACSASIIFPAVMGAGLLASDRRTGALQIYFSRPVSRLDYLIGKALAATFLVAMVTAAPCLLLWIESVAFGSSANFDWRTWIAPFVIVGASSFYALWSVALVLSLSSVMRRPAFVGIGAIGIYSILEAIGAILAKALDNKGWNVIRPSHAIGTLTAPLCGLDVPPWISPAAAFGVAFVLPIGLLALVWWRLKAVEVST